MKTRRPSVLALSLISLAVVAGATSPASANCTQTVMPVFQCGFVGWFGPVPGGAGTVTGVWWQLGYGNNRVNNGVIPPYTLEGTGYTPPATFSGNDSGLGIVYMTDARSVLPQYDSQIPPRSLCSNFENSWASPGIDGCADNRRTDRMVDDDDLLNPYWTRSYGPCPYDDCPYETTSYQVDYPMAVLLREGTQRFFAIAFVAGKTRHADGTDISEGFFDLGEVADGDPNPVTGRNNIIPWQRVPVPRFAGITPGSPDIAHLAWDNVRVPSDQSTRPTGPRPFAPVVAGGVGVLDQGPLVRYVLETAPLSGSLDPNDPGLVWSAVSEIAAPAGPLVTADVPYSGPLGVRVRTLLGKTPRTASTVLAQVRVGASGDLGFEAAPCTGEDCQDPPPALVLTACDEDADGDGFSLCQGDCADNDPAIHPGAAEVCDGHTNDCLATSWPDLTGDEVDDDGDGLSECQGDCLDTNPAVLPGGEQICDGHNNDCLSPGWPSLADLADGDDDGDGVTECEGDCTDLDPFIYPGAPEVCDGINNDCLNPRWPELYGGPEFDNDGDRYSVCRGDCDDDNRNVYPGAVQLCDGINNDCLSPGWPAITGLNDSDDDNDGYNECLGDCVDYDNTRYPGAPELCNQLDDDCDGLVDDHPSGTDSDGDGLTNVCDNCRFTPNPSQADSDDDAVGDACDNCSGVDNPGQANGDTDPLGDACDNCPSVANLPQEDSDMDQVGNACDNCPGVPNPDQIDFDNDGEGDACDMNDGRILIELPGPASVSYQQEAGFTSFNVYCGDMAVLRTAGIYTQDMTEVPLAGQMCSATGGHLEDPLVPPVGVVVFYMATGVDASGAEWTLGNTSDGGTRPNDNPCP